MFKAKVLILGPSQVGKTVLANFLSDATENIGSEYRPTKGVRVVEFESNNLAIKGRRVHAEVELWDCGGTGNVESCWPIFSQDVNGIIFVYNQDMDTQHDGESNPTHAQQTARASTHQKTLEKQYNHFVRGQGVRDAQCLVINQRKPRKDDDEGFDGGKANKYEVFVPDRMRGIPAIDADLDHDADVVKKEFGDFLSRILNVMSENREREESNIMNQR